MGYLLYQDFSHYLQGFCWHPKWCRISWIKSMYECWLFFSSGCSLWRHQECEDLPISWGEQSLLSEYTYHQPNPFQQPSQHPPISFFLHHAQYILLYALHISVSSFPVVFWGCVVSNQQQKSTKSGKKKQKKEIHKIHPKSQARYRWVKFKLLSSSINISFNCVVTELSIASSMGERQCTEVPTTQATEVPYLPMENKVDWWVYERPPSGKLTMVIEKWSPFFKMYSIYIYIYCIYSWYWTFWKLSFKLLCYLC